MDPVSQGVFGAIAAQNGERNTKYFGLAAGVGWLAGMAPDLDVLFRSSTDPLLALEFHRQFTHALVFIPIGALLCAFVFYYLISRRKQMSFGRTYWWCFLGYGTHGLLDSCTTYGTQLFWPFSDMRMAWNTVSIIDPMLTLPLLAFTGLAVWKKKRIYALGALAWIVGYSCLGVMQRERAEEIGHILAQSRGHEPVRLEAKPSFANILVWKIVYSTETRFYVDAVKIAKTHVIYEGADVPKLNVAQDFPWLDVNSQQAKDIERFRWFSNDYLALSPHHEGRIIDMRYSAVPNEIRGLWGIKLDENADSEAHVTKVFDRNRSVERFARLWNMIAENGF